MTNKPPGSIQGLARGGARVRGTLQSKARIPLTKKQQRDLCTRYGASRLSGITLAVLKELVTLNPLGKNYGEVDAEKKPFNLGTGKLAKRLGHDPETVMRHLRILEKEKLVTITKNEKGKSNSYLLRLGWMKTWACIDETEVLKKQLRQEQKLRWKRKDKAFRSDLANVILVNGCVKGVIKGETNRDRYLRQYRLVTVEEI